MMSSYDPELRRVVLRPDRRWGRTMDCLRGLDVSLEATRVCVVNGEDKVIRKRILPFDPDVIDLS